MLFALLEGFGASLSLIVAIGAQNAFVIRQGLLRKHLFLTASMCSLLDAFLISLGVLGFGELLSSYPSAIDFAKYFALVFLLAYGAFSFWAAFKPATLSLSKEKDNVSVKKIVWMLFALSLLNPHAYLDTVILLGSIASQRPENEQTYFALGAISASFIWFFSITYGSRLLAPLLYKPAFWRVVDIVMGCMMWGIAITLLYL